MTRVVVWDSPGGGRARIVGSAFGLKSEGDEVSRILANGSFDALLLGVSKEALATIKAAQGVVPETDPEELGPVERAYLEALSRFGPTSAPARELYVAWRAAAAADVVVQAIDLDDSAHTETYVDNVTVWENLFKSRRQLKRAARAKDEEDLAAFVKAWDAAFFPTKGLRKVERARERHMATRIRAALEGTRSAVAIVPLERLDGIVADLRTGPEPSD